MPRRTHYELTLEQVRLLPACICTRRNCGLHNDYVRVVLKIASGVSQMTSYHLNACPYAMGVKEADAQRRGSTGPVKRQA
jgi:hypothetical protein